MKVYNTCSKKEIMGQGTYYWETNYREFPSLCINILQNTSTRHPTKRLHNLRIVFLFYIYIYVCTYVTDPL